MTLTYCIDPLSLLVPVAAVSLLTACPGGTGDLGDHGSSSSDGSTSTPATNTEAGTGPGTGGTMQASSGGQDSGTEGTTGDGPCTEEECGPAPGAPNYLCPDGVNMGGPGPCERGPDGMCGWTFLECPPCCVPADEPQCFEGSTCCADGTWACNDDAGMPTCDEGLECACCSQAEIPDCIEGATCCSGGGWACNDDAGMPTCPGEVGIECEDSPGDCCEPAQEPPCIEGSICCDDGTWECLDPGGMPPCQSGEICGGGMCQSEGATCAGGEACCAGLDCCQGVPVPPGAEFCSSMCPISDRKRKENFETVDAKAVLETLVTVPITTWNYTFEDPSIRHLGPMAQDFKAAFSVGATDEKIFQIDADGVALASIQALHAEVEQLRSDNAKLQRTLEALQRRLDGLEAAEAKPGAR